MDHRDALYLCRLLRSYGERPCSRSTQCRDEIAPSHLTRLRKRPTHCPNYSNLERSARDKWHLPVQKPFKVECPFRVTFRPERAQVRGPLGTLDRTSSVDRFMSEKGHKTTCGAVRNVAGYAWLSNL